MTIRRVHLGCGPHHVEGWVNVDLIPGPAVDVVAPCDVLPWGSNTVDEILAEHLIEHLTFYQFNRALAEWHRVLVPGGTLTVECPDLLGLCKQFVEANEYGRYDTYRGQWPIIAHLYGHQRGRSPEEELSQVHKSGYTKEHLERVLYGVGFTNICEEKPLRAVPGTAALRITAVKADG